MADGSVRSGPDVNASVDGWSTDALRTCDDCDPSDPAGIERGSPLR